MEILSYLKTHSLLELHSDFGIKHSWDSQRTKFSLNYDQIFSPAGVEIVNECRGLVLRPMNTIQQDSMIVGDCVVLANPMKRFYNHGDSNASKIDIQRAMAYEKLDGTMCLLYFDTLFNRWCLATRSRPEADQFIRENDIETNLTFSDLFKVALTNVLNERHIKHQYFYDNLNKNYTYVFELTSEYNRIVVKYDVCSVTLLAIKDTQNNYELDIRSFDMCPIPKTFDLNSYLAIQAFVDSYDPTTLEGIVLCDSSFNRVKIKNINYVLVHKTKYTTTTSKRNILRAIINGTIDDIIPLLTQQGQDNINLLIDSFKNFVLNEQKCYDIWKQDANNDTKTFASFVNISNTPIACIHFNFWRKKTTSIYDGLVQLYMSNRLTDILCDKILDIL